MQAATRSGDTPIQRNAVKIEKVVIIQQRQKCVLRASIIFVFYDNAVNNIRILLMITMP
jgi:hypothetical protein